MRASFALATFFSVVVVLAQQVRAALYLSTRPLRAVCRALSACKRAGTASRRANASLPMPRVVRPLTLKSGPTSHTSTVCNSAAYVSRISDCAEVTCSSRVIEEAFAAFGQFCDSDPSTNEQVQETLSSVVQSIVSSQAVAEGRDPPAVAQPTRAPTIAQAPGALASFILRHSLPYAASSGPDEADASITTTAPDASETDSAGQARSRSASDEEEEEVDSDASASGSGRAARSRAASSSASEPAYQSVSSSSSAPRSSVCSSLFLFLRC